MVAEVKFAIRDSSSSGNVGAAQWVTLATTLRFRAADSNTGAATDNPLVRPTVSTAYSYTKNLRVRVVNNPATALLGLKVASTVAGSSVGGTLSGISLVYGFSTPASFIDNFNTAYSGKIGYIPINTGTPADWTLGRAFGGGGSPSVAGNHVASANGGEGVLGVNRLWGDTANDGTGGHDQLLLQMEISHTSSTGGSITPFNIVAIYNEI